MGGHPWAGRGGAQGAQATALPTRRHARPSGLSWVVPRRRACACVHLSLLRSTWDTPGCVPVSGGGARPSDRRARLVRGFSSTICTRDVDVQLQHFAARTYAAAT